MIELDIDYKAIGRRIRTIRKIKKLTQEALAEAVNLAPNHISNIETESTKLSLPALIHIAVALDTDANNLLYDNLPVLIKVYDADAKRILDDCNDKETSFLLTLLEQAKIALRKNNL